MFQKFARIVASGVILEFSLSGPDSADDSTMFSTGRGCGSPGCEDSKVDVCATLAPGCVGGEAGSKRGAFMPTEVVIEVDTVSVGLDWGPPTSTVLEGADAGSAKTETEHGELAFTVRA